MDRVISTRSVCDQLRELKRKRESGRWREEVEEEGEESWTGGSNLTAIKHSDISSFFIHLQPIRLLLLPYF